MGAATTIRRPGVAALLGAQFFTSVGDNALLIVAIALLTERAAPDWMTPGLRVCLYLSYVLLAPFGGALADAAPKGRIILLTNLVKMAACALMTARANPLLAFAAIGVLGACYGPAKYGILVDLVPGTELVEANAWIEIVTVTAILGGVALGSCLLATPSLITALRSPARAACAVLGAVYLLAAGCAAMLGGRRGRETASGQAGFARDLALLWRDPRGQLSLAVTTLFWAVAAVLQFLMIRWAGVVLHLSLAQSALLQVFLALGIVAGSLVAVRLVSARGALRVMPAGLVLGIAILLASRVTHVWQACTLLTVTGMAAGVLLAPMNALLQQRGDTLAAPGTSVAVQSFSENIGAIVFLAAYGGLLALDIPAQEILAGLGLLVIALMLAIQRRHRSFSRLRARAAAFRP
jgi:MFS transporter, LPLT family, lysophospholipid transporter